MARWEAEQLQASDRLRETVRHRAARRAAFHQRTLSTTNANQTTAADQADYDTIAAAQPADDPASQEQRRMWWLPTLAISALLIAGSLLPAWKKVTAANQAPARPRHSPERADLGSPDRTELDHLPYDGQQRPCRAVKD